MELMDRVDMWIDDLCAIERNPGDRVTCASWLASNLCFSTSFELYDMGRRWEKRGMELARERGAS